ncbi:hypothetical protein NL676_022105 [Syzygium grande]|nr:hypothetical protein NL676_022105 [Syzygium grande]
MIEKNSATSSSAATASTTAPTSSSTPTSLPPPPPPPAALTPPSSCPSPSSPSHQTLPWDHRRQRQGASGVCRVIRVNAGGLMINI